MDQQQVTQPRSKSEPGRQSKWSEKGLMLKKKCKAQNQLFESLAKEGKWATIHSLHYDWWAFPIDELSSYGEKYMLGPKQIDKLTEDQGFIQALRGNAILVCQAWGWDLRSGAGLEKCEKDQKWHNWPIRLYKMGKSLEIFAQRDLLENCVKYAMSLIASKAYFQYGKKDIRKYFQQKDLEIRNQHSQ